MFSSYLYLPNYSYVYRRCQLNSVSRHQVKIILLICFIQVWYNLNYNWFRTKSNTSLAKGRHFYTHSGMNWFNVLLSVVLHKYVYSQAIQDKQFKKASSITSLVERFKLDEFLKHQHCTLINIKRYTSVLI